MPLLNCIALPPEIVTAILNQLPTSSLAHFARCSRASLEITEPILWIRLLGQNQGVIPMFSCGVDEYPKISLEWLDALLRLPLLRNHVYGLAWNRHSNAAFSLSSIPPPTRRMLLMRYDYLEEELQALVSVGIITDKEKKMMQEQLNRGDDSPVWLVIYSLCPSIETIEFMDVAAELSFVLRKLVQYLYECTNLAQSRSRTGGRFPAPQFLTFYCRHAESGLNEISDALLLPSLRWANCTELNDTDPSLPFSWSDWRSTISGVAQSNPAWPIDTSSIVSHVQHLRLSGIRIRPDDLAEMIKMMPNLSTIRLVDNLYDNDPANMIHNTLDDPYEYYNRETERWVTLESFREYAQELKWWYRSKTGRDLPETIEFECWPNAVVENLVPWLVARMRLTAL